MDIQDLAPYLNKFHVISEVAKQIQKDFSSVGITIHFSGNTQIAYQELFEQIQSHVSDLMLNNYAKLLNILYRIDITEKQISTEVHSFSQAAIVEVITRLIVKRELQKVVIRNYYKNQ